LRILDVPASDRPRERLLSRGPEALSDRELVALLLGSGTGGCDAIELAGKLIAQTGGLYELSRAPAHEIAAALPGIGPAKAARVAAAFQLGRRAALPEATASRYIHGSRDLADAAAPLLRGLRHERVVVIVCARSGKILRTQVLTEGAADHNLLPVRDILSLVLATGGMAFGVAHNHPSGRIEASEPDRRATTKLAEGAEAVGLKFYDHVVVTDEQWIRIPYS